MPSKKKKKNKGSYQNQQDKRITEAIQSELKKALFRGMAVGAKTYCKMFLDEINKLPDDAIEKDKDAVIEQIRHFCEVGLGESKETQKTN